MSQQLLDQIAERKELVTNGKDDIFFSDDVDIALDSFTKIFAICEQIEIGHKIKERLKNERFLDRCKS